MQLLGMKLLLPQAVASMVAMPLAKARARAMDL